VFAFPLRDVVPSRTTPVVTISLITLNAVAFLVEQTLSDRQLQIVTMVYGLVPAEFNLTSLLASMFLHAGWLHFGGNMLFLWIFGDNVEDRLGHGRFLAFYLACGIAAAVGQTLSHPTSLVPMIGASGAIAGVMGAYFLLFPRSRVLTFVWVILFVDVVEIPAIYFLGFWFFIQLLSGVGSIGVHAGGTAFWAHAGGFLAGAALMPLLRRPERQRIEWVE
jgi:membrane associated rhomboid family serine protease